MPMASQSAYMPASPPPSLHDVPIVYFGNDWFAENRTSSHHIARLLGQRHPILYIENPGLRAPRASTRDIRKIWRKLARSTKPPQGIGEHMWLMTLPQIPFRRLPLVKRLNEICGRYLVRRALKRLGFRNVILWFVVPHPGALAGHLGERFVVYYCIDDYAGLPDVDQQVIAGLDRDLTRVADQVFVASATLLDTKRNLNRNTEHSPHGVDFDHFHAASDPTLPVAEGARDLPHPVIGFFGSIGGWVDIDLLLYLARARPQWTFLLIGLVSVDVRELRQCANVTFAGVQPYERLPDWARAFDVAILPYRLNRGSMNASPLKLREYLATGKPVVAASTPEIDRFGHCIRIARSQEEFLGNIEDALNGRSEDQRLAQTREVMGSTWEARTEHVLKVVYAGLDQKPIPVDR
jgi:glycosyltransferase involved in cell wall biosynthesis